MQEVKSSCNSNRKNICHTVTVFLQGQHYRKSYAFEFKILSLASLFAASFHADMHGLTSCTTSGFAN